MIKNDELCRKLVFPLNLFIPGSVSQSLSQRPSASKSYVGHTLVKKNSDFLAPFLFYLIRISGKDQESKFLKNSLRDSLYSLKFEKSCCKMNGQTTVLKQAVVLV